MQDNDNGLRSALDVIDRIRRRAVMTFWFGWILSFLTLLRFVYVLRTNDSIKAALSAAVAALVLVTIMSSFASMLFFARMTRRILRAIHLASGPTATSATGTPDTSGASRPEPDPRAKP